MRPRCEEAPVSITFERYVSNRLKSNIFAILLSRVVDLYMHGSNRRGGFGGSEFYFWNPPPSILGYSCEILNIPSESSTSIGTLFGQVGLRGVPVDMSKSWRHTRSGAGRGVSQANGAANHPKLTGLCQHEIASKTLKKWKQCGWDCASQLWVPYTDRSLVHGRPYLDFCPITLQHFNFRSY